MMKLIFLGTGGARHMVFSQVRKSGGMLFDFGDVVFSLDPGPGALVNARALKLNPEKWNGVMLSHLHIDHSTDANALLDGMTEPFLIAEQHCILPKEKTKSKFNYYPCVSAYHQKLVKKLYPVKPGDTVKIGSLDVKAIRTEHYDPTVGFLIVHPKIRIAYPSDGPYFPGQERHCEGADVLILNVLAPKGFKPDPNTHMSIDDAIRLVKSMTRKPKLIVLQHFSFWMLKNNLYKQCKILQDATGVKVLQAEDFMELDLETLKTRILKPETHN